MDKAELMQKEIENKRKLPEELKKEIKKNILHNVLIAVIIIVYLCIINILFYKLENNVFEQKMKFVALGIITVTVVTFEIAYRKQSKRMCIIGIELFLCSIISLYIPYIYLSYLFENINIKFLTYALPIGIALYYILKAYIIYKTGKIKHHNNLSDIKEILKHTEKESYLDEDSTKLYRQQKEFEEKTKKELLEEQHKKAKASKEKKTKQQKVEKPKSTKTTTKKKTEETKKQTKKSTSNKKKNKGL